MKYKILSIIIILTVLGLLTAGCTTVESISSGKNIEEQNNDNINIGENLVYEDDDIINIKKKDSDSSWDILKSTVISLDGETASVLGKGASVSGGTVVISEAGTYVVSGTLSKGQILINASKDAHVRLVLYETDITADKNAAIYAASADNLIIILADGTANTITDTNSYIYADIEKEEPDAAIFSKCDLTINGNGTLTVNANFKNGIKTKDDLVIVSGTYFINAVNNGLHGKDSVKITGGDFEIISGNDGIKSSDDSKKGWVEITGGNFNIISASDGIQAETDLLISGGKFNIITGGGSASAPVRSGMGMGGTPGGRGGFSPQQTAAADTESMKGLKAVNLVNISSGEFIIDTEDDGIHSDNDILISGGSFEIKTGDDGIHADNNVLITSGDINIVQSYEGIEGLTVTIEGGNISIIASDDGINASQGEGKALNMNGGNMSVIVAEGFRIPNEEDIGDSVPDRAGRTFSGSVNEEAFIRISGGTVDIHSGTDGLDSNGHIYIEGGILTISAPSQIMEGAIDKDGDLIITGGSVITAGSWDALPKESAQPVILMSHTQQLPDGTVFAIKDITGNVILEYTSKTAFSMSGFTSPDFETGETYALYINGEKRIDIMLNNIFTSISDDGGAYDAGRSGAGGGNMPGGANNMPNRGNMPNNRRR